MILMPRMQTISLALRILFIVGFFNRRRTKKPAKMRAKKQPPAAYRFVAAF